MLEFTQSKQFLNRSQKIFDHSPGIFIFYTRMRWVSILHF